MTEKSTEERQEAVKELIKKEKISDQMQLVTLLKEKYNIQTNQAVVSRDLRKLQVVKKGSKDALVYELSSVDVTQEILKLAIVDIKYNEMMIVITTHPGLAAFVGDFLDKEEGLNVLGSLAGENVVFVVPTSIKHIAKTYKTVCEKLHFK